jgi:hypothetical protein
MFRQNFFIFLILILFNLILQKFTEKTKILLESLIKITFIKGC